MWRTRRDPRIADEIRFHRDRLIEDYVASGMDRGEAERRAFLEFGNAVAIEESVRDVRGRWLDDLSKDLTYALRTLHRTPGFSFVAVLSQALTSIRRSVFRRAGGNAADDRFERAFAQGLRSEGLLHLQYSRAA